MTNFEKFVKNELNIRFDLKKLGYTENLDNKLHTILPLRVYILYHGMVSKGFLLCGKWFEYGSQ